MGKRTLERKGPGQRARTRGLIYFQACVYEIYWQKNFKCKKTLLVLQLLRESTFDSEKAAYGKHTSNSSNSVKISLPHTIGLISCTNTVLVASPCHPLFPLALTRNRAPGSTTLVYNEPSKIATSRFQLTHLGDHSAMVARDNLKLHSSSSLTLPGVCRIP